MVGPSFSKYLGYMKQPIIQPELYAPSMYMLSDTNKQEMDLILLTPGTYNHAYQEIKNFNPISLRLFIPSLRPEFISDIFNLYMLYRDHMLIKWVFPDSYNHYDFSFGQIQTDSYQNQANTDLTIHYERNPNVDGVYDIIARSQDACNYFSFFLTEQKLSELMQDEHITFIHVAKSSTLYGGLTYDQILEAHRKHPSVFKRRIIANDFTSADELRLYMTARRYADYKRKR